MKLLQYLLTLTLITTLSISANAQEQAITKIKNFPDQGYAGPRPVADANGTVIKKDVEQIQAINFITFDSLANSLSYWNEYQVPFVYEPESGMLYTIKRGPIDQAKHPDQFSAQTSKNNLFVRVSSDMGFTWMPPELVYDSETYNDQQARFPSLRVLNIDEGGTQGTAIAYVTGLVNEQLSTWYGYAIGVHILGESGNALPTVTFESGGNQYQWGWYSPTTAAYSTTETKFVLYDGEGYDFTILGATVASPVDVTKLELLNAFGYYKTSDLDNFNETVPPQWASEVFNPVTQLGYRSNNAVDIEKSPVSDKVFFAVYGRLNNAEMNTYLVSSSTDRGTTWSPFITSSQDVIRNFATSVGMNPDSTFSDFQTKDFHVFDDNKFAFYTVLWERDMTYPAGEQVRNRMIVELYYDNGSWGIRKIADLDTPIPFFLTNESGSNQVVEGQGYEIQVVATADGSKLVVKWIEGADPTNPQPDTWTYTYTHIYYSTRGIEQNQWGPKRMIADGNATQTLYKATWLPNVLPNDLVNVPLIYSHTVLEPGTPDAAQKLYLNDQLVRVGHFNPTVPVEDNPAIAAELGINGIYPNPAVANAYVALSVPQSGNYEVELYNILGETIKSFGSEFFYQGEATYNINISDVPSGTYYLTIRNGEMKTTQVLNVVR